MIYWGRENFFFFFGIIGIEMLWFLGVDVRFVVMKESGLKKENDRGMLNLLKLS